MMAIAPDESSSPSPVDLLLDIKNEIKEESDVTFLSSRSTGRRTGPPIPIKFEEPENATVDLTLPENENMFQDVDENDGQDEIVDLTYEGIAEVNGKSHFVCEGFQIPQIPEPLIVKRKLIDIFNCIEAGSIILQPEYQRDVVWDEAQAGLLVTSILMGYFVPPIIFNVKKSPVKIEGREQMKILRACVDGKQRLTSICKFMRGEIGFFDSGRTQRKWYYCHKLVEGEVEVSNRNILPNAVKMFFDSRFFCTYEYEGLDIETEENMFQLVQRGIALTPAEKMRALSTEWAIYTRQFEDDYQLVINLSKQSRASGFRLILTIFTMVQEIMAGRRKKGADLSAPPTLQASPQALMRVLESTEPISLVHKLKFKAIFDRYERLVRLRTSVFDAAPMYLQEAGVNHCRTFSPLELLVTGVLVALHGMEKRKDGDLLNDIKELRRYLRSEHRDLRVNAQCWNSGWHFITEIMEERGSKAKLSVPVRSATNILISSQGGSRYAPGGVRTAISRNGSSSPLSSAPESESEDESGVSSSSSDSESESDDGLDFPGFRIVKEANPITQPEPVVGTKRTRAAAAKTIASQARARARTSSSAEATKKRGRSLPRRSAPSKRSKI